MEDKKIKEVKNWFKSYCSIDDEDYNNSTVNYLGKNLFQAENIETKEIHEMIIPVKHFKEFKKLHMKKMELLDKINKIYNIVENKYLYQHEIDEVLNNNNEYQELNQRHDNLEDSIKKLYEF